MMRQEQEDLVSGCSIIGVMKADISMKKSTASAVSNLKEEKQERHSDSISRMLMNRGGMLFDAFESVPDEDVASTCSG